MLQSAEAMPEAQVDCAGCYVPCCRHADMPVLLRAEEVQRGLAFALQNVVLHTGGAYQHVAVLAKNPVTKECVYLAHDNKCSIWAQRPMVCREYDCRNDPSMAKLVASMWPSGKKLGL